MLYVENASWRRRRLALCQVGLILLEKLGGKACWRCGKYLGSMLYFDFGEKVKIQSGRHGEVLRGECTASIYECFWILRKGEQVIIDSDSISDENAAEKLSVMDGRVFRGFQVETGWVNLLFSEDVVLKLDSTNKHGANSSVAEFRVSDGRIFFISPKGYFYLSDMISAVRSDGSKLFVSALTGV